MLTFLLPLVYRIFIDDVVVGGKFTLFFTNVLIGYGFIQLVKVGLSYLSMYYNNRLSYHLLYKIKNKIFGNYVREDIKEESTKSVADVKMNIEDDTKFLKEFIEKQMVDYFISVFSIIIACIFLFSVSWQLSLIAVAIIPITIWFDLFISNKEKNIVNLNRKNDEEMTSWFHEVIRGWKEIKAFNLERYEKKKYVKFLNIFAKYHTKTINYFVIRYLVMPWVKEKFVMQILLYFVGGIFVIQGRLTIGMLLMFVQYNTILSDSVNKVSSTEGDLLSQKTIIDRIINVLSIKAVENKNKIVDEVNDIKIQQVSYRYPNQNHYVLKEVNLSISKGERVVIYGSSGAGKSTLVKLITGIVDPSQGDVYYSGYRLRDVDKKSLYRKIGYVMQDSILFNMSIREYFQLIKPKATEEEMKVSCQKAQIYDLIRKLPDYFDTNLGEGGSKISGGQKQRIILAGQILKNADVIILDEATRHLEQQTEDILYKELDDFFKDKMIIYISHRKPNVAFGSRFIQVHNGCVIEREAFYVNN
ncbi:ABC transporter ATP-binding protein/permease [Lederbergia sp. NSJ-179]|nr:ABC transporter ATP-binding protein/permease [Lederbergia sp. NSJ-179]